MRLEHPWWEHLDPEFSAGRDAFELVGRDRARVAASAAFDTGLRSWVSLLVGLIAAPKGFNRTRLHQDIADEGRYLDAAEARDPTRFFTAPSRDVAVRSRPVGRRLFSPGDGTVEKLTFESGFRPASPRLAGIYELFAGNRIVHARAWWHRDGPRPTVVALHGFAADSVVVNERLFEVRALYGLGCDVVLVTLPFHGARRGRRALYSGQGFFSNGLAVINEAFAQAVHDVRRLMHYLEDVKGVTAIGVTGVSLGGYTSALLAAVEPRLAFALPNVPVASLPDIMLEWYPLNRAVRAALRINGWSIVDFRRFLAVTSPLTYLPLLPKERLMIIGGVGDRFAPPKHSLLLWEHWDRPRLHWFPGSHLFHLDKGEYEYETGLFLREIGFLK
jgi:pimeloyl-ACP methyl ester carboxylesterase